MSQENPLSQVSKDSIKIEFDKFLDKAVQELKDKESKEEELDLQVKILEGKLEVKQNQLKIVESNLETANGQLNNRTKLYTQLEKDIVGKDIEKVAISAKINSLREQLVEAQKPLGDIETEIKNSKKYLSEQETTVDETIAEWNDRLTEFVVEGTRLEEVKVKLVRENFVLERQKEELSLEIESQRQTVEQIAQNNLENIRVSEKRVAGIETAISEAQLKLEQTINKYKNIETGFKAREKELRIKELSVARREIELNQKEQYLNSRLSLVG